jgi:pimeloyl-ACP methyl ester carboxylesterase
MRRFRVIAVMLAIATTALVASPAAAQPQQAATRCASFNGPLCSVSLPTGVTMRYLDIGPADGPVTLLLHGFADDVQSWSLVVPQLQRLMPWARFLIPDLRGHGETTQPPAARCAANPDNCFRPIDYANDVMAFLDAEHVARVTILGHSVGTLVAQEIALDHPSRVSRLVLVSTATNGQQPLVEAVQSEVVQGEWQQDFTAAGYTWPSGVYGLNPGVAVPDFTQFIDDEYETSSVAPPALLTELQAGAQTVRVGTWIGTLDDLVIADNTMRLQHLGVPTLVLYAIQDDVFSPDAEQQLISSLDAAASHGTPFWWKQYGALPPPDSGEQTDLGHNLPWEAPAGVAADTAAFLVLGVPTCTLYRTDYPADIHRVLAIPNAATIVHAGAGPDCLGRRAAAR